MAVRAREESNLMSGLLNVAEGWKGTQNQGMSHHGNALQ